MLVGTIGYRLAHITVAQEAPSEIGSGATITFKASPAVINLLSPVNDSTVFLNSTTSLKTRVYWREHFIRL